jgi:hypothetical protein
LPIADGPTTPPGPYYVGVTDFADLVLDAA